MPAISVVVPVYNVEKYLSACLYSLRNQTLSDIEIICVNDGSTDGSAEIAKQHAALDHRILLVNKPNGGLSSARNAGMKRASGKCVCFVDSDDSLTPDACEKIVAAFAKNEADVVTYGANCYPEFFSIPWLDDVLSPRDAFYDAFDLGILFKEKSRPYAWRTALRTGFIKENGIEFDETVKFGEDQVFHFAVYPRAAKTVFIADKLYNYRLEREGSLMNTYGKNLLSKYLQHICIAEHIVADWRAGGFYETYCHELFSWTADFLVTLPKDIPTEQRAYLMGRIAAFWRRDFASELERLGQWNFPEKILVEYTLEKARAFEAREPEVAALEPEEYLAQEHEGDSQADQVQFKLLITKYYNSLGDLGAHLRLSARAKGVAKRVLRPVARPVLGAMRRLKRAVMAKRAALGAGKGGEGTSGVAGAGVAVAVAGAGAPTAGDATASATASTPATAEDQFTVWKRADEAMLADADARLAAEIEAYKQSKAAK